LRNAGNAGSKRKTRPGGQPDGSSHMGAWGGWALAPNTALWGGFSAPTSISRRRGRARSTLPANFLTSWQGFLWPRRQPICRTPLPQQAGSGFWSREPIAGPTLFRSCRHPKQPAPARWLRPPQGHPLRRHRIDRHGQEGRDRERFCRIARTSSGFNVRIALQDQGGQSTDVSGGKRGC
jgi:hypothetical protein